MADGKLIYLSLGSNLGDRAANLECAVESLSGIGVRALCRSATYETEPVDFLEHLDILFYGTIEIHETGMEIPHPRLAERRFVLVPLAELAPEFRHPALHKTATELLAATKDRSSVRIWQPIKGASSSQ